MGAERKEGKTQWVTVRSLAGEPCRIKVPDWSGAVVVTGDITATIQPVEAGEYILPLKQGGQVLVMPREGSAQTVTEFHPVKSTLGAPNHFGIKLGEEPPSGLYWPETPDPMNPLDQLVKVDLQGNPLARTTQVPATPLGTPQRSEMMTPALYLLPTYVPNPKGMVLVCPGGGYNTWNGNVEGFSPAEFLNSQGYDVAILEYTHRERHPGKDDECRPLALKDALAAVNLLKTSREKLGLHTSMLGMMGFQAGGHLAARTMHELGTASPFTKIFLMYPANLDAPGGLNPEVKPPKGLKTQIFVAVGDMYMAPVISSSQAFSEAAKANGEYVEYHLLPGINYAFGVRPGGGLLHKTIEFNKKLKAFLAK